MKKAATDQSGRTPQVSHFNQQTTQYYSGPDDRSMFSQQFTRQLSTSPPPFSYSSYPPETITYAPYSHSMYQPLSTATQDAMFAPYLPPLGHASTYPPSLPSMVYPVKQEYYAEDEMSPFTMSYASMAGIDIPQAQAYQDHNPQIHTPPLSESFEHSNAGSPPELSNYPRTPASMPGTPPLRLM